MPDDLASLAGRLTSIADALSGDGLTAITGEVAFAAKRDALEVLEADLPGRKFRNWRPRMTVRYTQPTPSAAILTPRPLGPWVVANSGRLAGRRAPRRGTRRSVSWGSTRGRHTWDRAVTAITERTPARVRQAVLRLYTGKPI